MRTNLLLATALALVAFSLPSFAQQFPMTTEQCLSCHGPFDTLIQKNAQFPTDPKPVNPHAFVPHNGEAGKFYDCIACHKQHPLPAPKGYKDTDANIEPCYSCHHGEQVQNCKNCHKD